MGLFAFYASGVLTIMLRGLDVTFLVSRNIVLSVVRKKERRRTDSQKTQASIGRSCRPGDVASIGLPVLVVSYGLLLSLFGLRRS